MEGIKESMEFLAGVEVLGVTGKKVLADGKVNAADIPHVFGLIQNLGVLNAAVQGVDQIPKEAKDYSSDELQAIGAKVLAVMAAIKNA